MIEKKRIISLVPKGHSLQYPLEGYKFRLHPKGHKSRKAALLGIIICGLTLFAHGCTFLTTTPAERKQQTLYSLPTSNETVLSKYAPLFLIEDSQKDYNRIGSPAIRLEESNEKVFFIDTRQPSVYAMIQEFETDSGSYTNLIYRVHFPKTPLPHLTAGKNVGLLVYITLNSEEEPVLVTTLHTCGCYLAFIPTGKLPDEAKPAGWPDEEQVVYGEVLPAQIEKNLGSQKVVIKLRSETHRVTAVQYSDPAEFGALDKATLQLRPMDALNRLPVPDSSTTESFFRTSPPGKGLVKGSSKPLEMLFMSWWAVDAHIGIDKALGPPEETGAIMYTSLKFWAREESNIWYFARFLGYWGWDL